MPSEPAKLSLCDVPVLIPHVQFWGDNAPVLSMAVTKGDKATVVALIEAGANVNARDGVRAVRVHAALVTTLSQ